jgi:hypothetical protein
MPDALPRNTHLRKLDLSSNGMSAASTAERLLPAASTNASPGQLGAGDSDDEDLPEGLMQAVDFVAEREQARLAAEAAAAS